MGQVIVDRRLGRDKDYSAARSNFWRTENGRPARCMDGTTFDSASPVNLYKTATGIGRELYEQLSINSQLII